MKIPEYIPSDIQVSYHIDITETYYELPNFERMYTVDDELSFDMSDRAAMLLEDLLSLPGSEETQFNHTCFVKFVSNAATMEELHAEMVKNRDEVLRIIKAYHDTNLLFFQYTGVEYKEAE